MYMNLKRSAEVFRGDKYRRELEAGDKKTQEDIRKQISSLTVNRSGLWWAVQLF